MKKKLLKITSLLSAVILTLSSTSCQPPVPGSNQPAVTGYAIVYQPCSSIYREDNSALQVGFTMELNVITLDANHNAVFFGPEIDDSHSTSSSSPSIAPSKQYNFGVPKQAAYWNMEVDIETTDCGGPSPEPSLGQYVKLKYKVLSPTLPIPVQYTFSAASFSLRNLAGC